MQTLYDSVYNNILTEMQKQNKSQKELTDYLKVSKSTFTDWKSGKSKSFMKHLPEIADFLDVSVDYLSGKTDVKISTTPKEWPISEIEKEILFLTAGMDEDEKNALLGYAARLISKRKKEDQLAHPRSFEM